MWYETLTPSEMRDTLQHLDQTMPDRRARSRVNFGFKSRNLRRNRATPREKNWGPVTTTGRCRLLVGTVRISDTKNRPDQASNFGSAKKETTRVFCDGQPVVRTLPECSRRTGPDQSGEYAKYHPRLTPNNWESDSSTLDITALVKGLNTIRLVLEQTFTLQSKQRRQSCCYSR